MQQQQRYNFCVGFLYLSDVSCIKTCIACIVCKSEFKKLFIFPGSKMWWYFNSAIDTCNFKTASGWFYICISLLTHHTRSSLIHDKNSIKNRFRRTCTCVWGWILVNLQVFSLQFLGLFTPINMIFFLFQASLSNEKGSCIYRTRVYKIIEAGFEVSHVKWNDWRKRIFRSWLE